MKKLSLNLIAFVLILFLAIGLRFYQLGSVPIELNRDEASLGYTAYSILKTGHEEHGVYWPINIESFGDWKLPGYVYTLIPFIQVLGLEPWVVRLPSAISGVAVVVLGWLLAKQLSQSLITEKNRSLFSLIVMFFLAISPWDIHLSHMAYEAHLAMALMLGAVNLFIWSVQKNNQQNKWLLLSVILFGLTLFTYHSYQVFTPLMAISLLVIYRENISKIWRNSKSTILSSVALAGFFSLALISTSIQANQTKFAGLSIFDKKVYLPAIEVNRSYFEDRNSLLAKLHDNTLALFLNQVQQNFANMYSARFLFFEGGTHGSHDIPGTGKMYPIEFIFILFGLYQLLTAWQQKKISKAHSVITIWVIIATIAPIITLEPAHTIRFSPVIFAFIAISSLGLTSIINNSKKFKWLILGILSLLVSYSLIYFLITYFVVSPKREINNHNWQMKRLIELINQKGNTYDHIYMPGATWSPYIYFLFYNKIDPKTNLEQLQFFPLDHEGFKYAKKLGKMDFSAIDWEKTPANTLVVIKKKEVPADKLEMGEYQLEYSLTDPWAKDEWLLISHP